METCSNLYFKAKVLYLYTTLYTIYSEKKNIFYELPIRLSTLYLSYEQPEIRYTPNNISPENSTRNLWIFIIKKMFLILFQFQCNNVIKTGKQNKTREMFIILRITPHWMWTNNKVRFYVPEKIKCITKRLWEKKHDWKFRNCYGGKLIEKKCVGGFLHVSYSNNCHSFVWAHTRSVLYEKVCFYGTEGNSN